MNQLGIDTLRSEALRQIDLLIQLLQDTHAGGLLQAPASSKDERRSLDTESQPQAIEMLENERRKLENLDMVLAVVGTMKAGKSTTINAIVGAEVLPNRNRPMTALPTLIRHTPGQTQPRLTLEKVQPLTDLLARLRPALEQAAPSTLKSL